MEKIKIVTDSTCDLSKEIIEQMSIHIVPLYVSIGGKQYKDTLDIIEKELYELVEIHKELPKTAAPSPEDYHEVFEKYIAEGYKIICLTISSKMSASYQNAVIGADLIENGQIKVIDSGNLSTGIGLLVTKSYDLIQAGHSLEDISKEIEEARSKVSSSFTIETYDYLYKGGRCSAMSAVVGSMLKIKPIIQVLDKSMTVGAKLRGNKQKALRFMMDDAMNQLDKEGQGRLFITHTKGSEEEASYMKKQLEETLPNMEIIITHAGCVIASHCGQKTIGVLFIKPGQ